MFWSEETRMQGFNALWVPEQTTLLSLLKLKVVAKLKSEGINKSDITRDEFFSSRLGLDA